MTLKDERPLELWNVSHSKVIVYHCWVKQKYNTVANYGQIALGLNFLQSVPITSSSF